MLVLRLVPAFVCFAYVGGVEFNSKPLLVTKLAANETVHYDLPASSKPSALVVFWTEFYGRNSTWMLWFSESLRAKTCPHLPCYFTEDGSLLKLADAVVFHGYYTIDPTKPYETNFPTYRRPDQRWVFVTSESPLKRNYTAFDGVFDWTVTCRSDSSVFMHYGRMVLRPSETKKDGNKNYAQGKTKVAAMFDSHCPTSGRGELCVKELRKHMDVDVYGKCGKLRCAGRFQIDVCTKMLEKRCKFFLSFENNICKDYSTEKLSNILASSGVVPVTLGGADYESLFPNNSYINALSYKSPKELADYLKMLDKNDTLYNRYFDWKRNQDVQFFKRL